MRYLLSFVALPRTLFLATAIGATHLSCASGGRGAGAGLVDPLSRVEALARILLLEDSRSLGGGGLISFLRHPEASVRRRAVLAAGRIGDPLALSGVIAGLKDPEVEVRRASALALGLMGRSEAVAALMESLSDGDSVTRGRAAEALGRIGQSSSGPLIGEAFRRAVPNTPEGVLKIRGDDPGRADDPWVELRLHLAALARLKDGESLAKAVIGTDTSPFIDWWVAVWAAAWVGDPRLTPVLLTGASAEDPYIRALAARGLGMLKDPTHLGLIRRLAEDREPSVVREALRASVLIGGSGAAAIASLHLDSTNLLVRREALLALASLPPAAAQRARVIENVGHPDAWVRAAAWPALIRIDAEDVGLVLSTIGPDADWQVRRSVATALGENLGERAAPLLLPMLKDEDVRVIPAVLEALARARGGDAVATLEDHVTHADTAVRAAAVQGLSLLVGGEPRLATALNRAFAASFSDEDVETRVHIVEAASRKPDASSLELLRRIAGSDPSRAVRQEAMKRLGDGRAAPERSAIRGADARRLVSVYEPGAEPRYSPRVIISTRRGEIEIVLDLVEAPLSSLSFVRLAESGFFNGLTFHRVIPGFVAQGGDPRGDGHGGPGFTVRSEYSGRPFGRGALGMASAGKDTGGSQFFIALEPLPQLDGAYTQFGQVLAGLDVVEKLRPGDTILRVEVFDGRGEP